MNFFLVYMNSCFFLVKQKEKCYPLIKFQGARPIIFPLSVLANAHFLIGRKCNYKPTRLILLPQ
jgi:hypothetical protein